MPAFDWAQYLVLAKELSKKSEEEAALRSAISRAYYAAFNEARSYCDAKGFEIPRSLENNSHQVVWNAFLGRGRSLGGVQVQGDRLRRKRVQADYHPEIERLSDLVEQSLRESDAVFSYLRTTPGSRPSSATH